MDPRTGEPGGAAGGSDRAAASQALGAPRRRGRGGLVLALATAACFFLLTDLTETRTAALLAPLGAALACGGVYLTLGSARYVLESPWYAGLLAVGLLMLLGAAAILAPAMPGALLARTAQGWEVLERRIQRLASAIEAGDVDRARKIAGRGLGDPVARDASGAPVLHQARSAEMVAALLESGLDPDAADDRGHTLLMRSSDVAVSRALLAAGADPNARDRQGSTALMHRGGDSLELAELLLEAGADVHAVNDSGRTVADLVGGPGRTLLPRYAGGVELAQSGGVAPRGRDEWLVANPGTAGRRDGSGVSLPGGPLRPGDVGALSIVVDNPSSEDRVLDLRAVLDNAVLFVGASHDGAVEARGRPGPTRTVRWPLLSLPAGGQGRLELHVLARPDDAVEGLLAGDLSVDVFVVDLPQRTERVLQLRQERSGPPARADGRDPATLAPVLLPFTLATIGWLVWQRRRGGEGGSARRFRIGRAVAGGAALVCVAIGGGLLWSMVEPYARFAEATCEVLDQRVLARGAVRPTTFRTGVQSPRVLQGHPLAAVSIDTGEERVVAAGWATGMASRSVHELRAIPIGSETRCWLDPDDARRFTLFRTPSPGGLVGLAMLLGAAIALGLVAARLGRGGSAVG